MDKEAAIRTLQMIADDMRDDVKNFDGQPFNGRTVAEYIGNQGAAIAAIANIVRLSLVESHPAADAVGLSVEYGTEGPRA